MTTPGDGAQSPRRWVLLPGSSLATRIAFLLAFMGGIAWAGFGVKAVGDIRPNRSHFTYTSSGTIEYPPSSAWAWWTIGVGCLAAVLLLWGAAMFAMREPASRIVIVIGCGVVTAYNILSIVADSRARSRPVHDAIPLPLELSVVIVAFAAVTVVFMFIPSTRRWFESPQEGVQDSDAVDS